MSTATEPAVLFRMSKEVSDLLRSHRDFALLDEPENTSAALKAWEVAKALDEEAGAWLRYALRLPTRERKYHMANARLMARASNDLHEALRNLNSRWSGEDQPSDTASHPIKRGE